MQQLIAREGSVLEEGEYPYASYVITYGLGGSANVCGLVHIESGLAVTAGHCFDNQSKAYLGYSLFDFSVNDNYLADEVVVNPNWNGKDVIYDIAIIKPPEEFYENDSYAIVGSPSVGCGYEVYGYGQSEKDFSMNNIQKLSKKSDFCIEKIDDNLIFLRGDGGGICFGDSGSPVFHKESGELVGIISSIISSDEKGNINPCSVGNKAVAVRIDAKKEFIDNYRSGRLTVKDFGICGEDCKENTCAFGLICNEDEVCIGEGGSCTAAFGEYCSPDSDLVCNGELSCEHSKCKADTVLKSYLEQIKVDMKNIVSKETSQELRLSLISKYFSYTMLSTVIAGFLMGIVNRVRMF